VADTQDDAASPMSEERFTADELHHEELTFPDGIRVVMDTPKALQHLYPIPKLGAVSIPLYRGQFDVDGETFQGVASLSLDPHVELEFGGKRPFTGAELADGFRVRAEPRAWINRESVTLADATKVPIPPKTDRADMTTRLPRQKGRVVRGPLPVELGRDEPVDRVTFFVLNGWRAAMDGFLVHCGTHQWRGGLRFDAGDWEFTFTMRPDAAPDDVLKRLRRKGERTVTYVGMIRRTDRQRFLPSESGTALEVLEVALAFALGRTTACVLPVGWVGDDATWTRWHVGRWVERVGGRQQSWLDELHTGQQLRELVGRLLTIRGDALRWDVFEHALGYYLTAQDTTPQMQCNLAVPALTFMSEAALVAAYPVGDPNRMSKGKWNDLGTQVQIRELLTAMSVDMSVPAHFADLDQARIAEDADLAAAYASNPGGKPPPDPADALSLLVKMRNDVAHPKRDRVQHYDFKQWVEAGDCGIDFLLLALLHWVGYEGPYISPTALYGGGGSSVTVPWVPPPTAP
jgi:hypothetical protein